MTKLKAGLIGAAAVAIAMNGAAQAQSDAEFARTFIERTECSAGLQKEVIVRGEIDDFSTQGSEPGRMRSEVAAATGWPSAGQFDQTGQNARIVDYLDIPSDTVEGAFIMSLRGLSGSGNDFVGVGNMATPETFFATRVSYLNWPTQGRVHIGELDDIDLRVGGTLLDYIQSGSGTTPVDAYVNDDTAVDFFAVIACRGQVTPPPVDLFMWVTRQNHQNGWQQGTTQSYIISPGNNRPTGNGSLAPIPAGTTIRLRDPMPYGIEDFHVFPNTPPSPPYTGTPQGPVNTVNATTWPSNAVTGPRPEEWDCQKYTSGFDQVGFPHPGVHLGNVLWGGMGFECELTLQAPLYPWTMLPRITVEVDINPDMVSEYPTVTGLDQAAPPHMRLCAGVAMDIPGDVQPGNNARCSSTSLVWIVP